MGKYKKTARKALAVFSAAALLLSCGATGFVTGIADTSIKAEAASPSTVATQLKVFDENGNDLGDNPIIYIDNSEAAGKDSVYHNVSRSFRIVASNDNGVAVEDDTLAVAQVLFAHCDCIDTVLYISGRKGIVIRCC